MDAHYSNEQLVQKAGTLTTAGVTSGILNPEQSARFLQQTFESCALNGFVRHEMRTAQKGEIDKAGIARRLLRKKTENTDDGYRAQPGYGKVEYSVEAVRLPWEVTEETYRQNIEGQSHEATITNLMTTQMGLDQEDLCLNGDEDIPGSHEDANFLNINDGWVKQVRNGGHVVNAAGLANITLDVWYDGLASMPNKYNNGKLRWLMSPRNRQEWERHILKQAVEHGGIVTDKRVENPAAIPVIEVPSMPNDTMLLVPEKNFIIVNTYGVIIRKTTEGKEAIMQDKRFYVVHFDFDPIVEELDATVAITGLKIAA